MRLADFIDAHTQEIMADWEAFAATRLPAAAEMSSLELRNHAPLILRAIAADLRAVQSAQEQVAKSQGRAPVTVGAPQTAAQVHGVMRARSGFHINQMVSEYRALRASVLRLWAASRSLTDLELVIEDIIRFNEAIDQAITESVALFTDEIERGRNLFLGVLGHELRSPLNAIQATARYLGRIRGDTLAEAVQHLIHSGARMKGLLDDLLEYSRTKLSLGILVRPTECSLEEICMSVIDEIRTVDPDNKVQLRTSGEVTGMWDARRLQQVVSNLVSNAIAYADADTPIELEVIGSERDVTVTVSNKGPPIPREGLQTLFEPLQRGEQGVGSEEGAHLGLGLFIAREIIRAHHGEIEAHSHMGETVFRVLLPRRA